MPAAHKNKTVALGTTEEGIAEAETALGFRFPEDLREAWKLYNCNELRGGWRVFPIFDPANPRKTCTSISFENLKGAWGQEVMAEKARKQVLEIQARFANPRPSQARGRYD